jgi:hypothetical protein
MGRDVQEFDEGTHSNHIFYIEALIEYIYVYPQFKEGDLQRR